MALVDIDHPTVIHDQRLLGLFQFWRSRLNGRRMPASGDLDRADLAPWADNLMLIDVPGEMADFRIRWLGANLVTMFGTRRAGTGIEAMTSVGERSSVLPQYRVVIDTGVPAYSSSVSAGWLPSRSSSCRCRATAGKSTRSLPESTPSCPAGRARRTG